MSLNFETTFGRTAGRGNIVGGKAQDDRPKAQYWINLGYAIQVHTEEGVEESRFVSLPVGIPLDTMERLKTTSQNEVFAAFQTARNDFLDQLLEIAATLEPGGEKIIAMGESGLAMQIRRVNDEKPAVKAADNQFVKRLAFA